MTAALEVSNFRARFERTIAGLNVRLESHQILLLSKVFRTVSWRFQDLELQIFLVIDGDPHQLELRGEPGEDPTIHLAMESGLLDSAIKNKFSFAEAFLSGKLRVTGATPLQLTKFMHLLSPLLESYREALEVADVKA
jgi:hypothetical protein